MPTLVLVGLHVGFPHPTQAEPDRQELSAALETCRLVLACARRRGMPVAFVRHMPPLPSFLATQAYPPWMRGIEPGRSDMIFERALPSCYASSEFAQMAARSSELVLAGLFGETACLSTLIEAGHRNHQFTFLTDASCSRGRYGLSPADVHRSVVALSSLYAKLSSAQSWMQKVSVGAGVVR
jgi:nicotinamidase-related amidase